MKKIVALLVLISLLMLIFLLAGCNNDFIPNKTNDKKDDDKDIEPPNEEIDTTKQIFYNLSYGTHSKQKIDIFLPNELGQISRAVNFLVFLHAGTGWEGGNRNDIKPLAEYAIESGIAAILVGYRQVSDGATYVEMLQDISLALSFILQNGESYKLLTAKTALLGDTEGGHLALLYTYSQKSPIPISFVVSKSGYTDLTDIHLYNNDSVISKEDRLSQVSKLTGTNLTMENLTSGNFPNEVRLASPLTYATNKNLPYSLLLYSTQDEMVSHTNGSKLHNALQLSSGGKRSDLVNFSTSHDGLMDDEKNYKDALTRLTLAILAYLINP